MEKPKTKKMQAPNDPIIIIDDDEEEMINGDTLPHTIIISSEEEEANSNQIVDSEEEEIEQEKILYKTKVATRIDSQIQELIGGGKVHEALERFCGLVSEGSLQFANFACGGKLNDSLSFLPGIEVRNTSGDCSDKRNSMMLSLPIISNEYMNDLKRFSYTCTKTNVNNPYNFMCCVKNNNWSRAWEQFVNAKIRNKLGIDESIRFNMYEDSIMVLSEGCSFSGSPIDDNVFSAMLIQLPSDFESEDTDICVEYNGHVEKFNFTENSTFTTYYIAFHPDCEIKIPKVTRGHRVFMVYIMDYNETEPPTIENSPFLNTLKLIVDQFKNDSYMIRVLAEQYKRQELSYSHLKGKDQNLVSTLKRYTEKFHDLAILLVKLQKEVEGSDEDRYGSDSPDYFITSALRKDKPSICKYEISEEKISPEDALENAKSVSKKVLFL